jgi:polar amino acid transport system substrate-binding protein
MREGRFALGLLTLLCLASSALSEPSPAPKPTVTLAADDWCPQHCQGDPVYRGYIVELVVEAFARAGVNVEIVYLPWLRAMAEVKRGSFDGLLTPTAGYQGFVFHRETMAQQQYCFYTRRDSTFRYSAPESLLGRRIAYLKDSGLGALDDYFARNKERLEAVEFASGRGFVSKIFEFLRLGRADVIVMSSDVYRYAVRRRTIPDVFREAGCLEPEKLVVGFSQLHPERSRALADALDQGLRSLRESGRAAEILARYGMD